MKKVVQNGIAIRQIGDYNKVTEKSGVTIMVENGKTEIDA